MGTQIYNKLTGDNNDFNSSNASNYVIQYVDDSSNLISTANANHLNIYVDKYFNILEQFYNLNKLTLNSDKTKSMIVCKPNI